MTSITFPPTREPTVLPPDSLETSGDVTPDPFDQYYEDYDTEDLPPLDLDLPSSDRDLPGAAPTTAATDAPKQVRLPAGWRGCCLAADC